MRGAAVGGFSLLHEVARAIQMPERPIASWGLSRPVEPAGEPRFPPPEDPYGPTVVTKASVRFVVSTTGEVGWPAPATTDWTKRAMNLLPTCVSPS